ARAHAVSSHRPPPAGEAILALSDASLETEFVQFDPRGWSDSETPLTLYVAWVQRLLRLHLLSLLLLLLPLLLSQPLLLPYLLLLPLLRYCCCAAFGALECVVVRRRR